MKMNARSSGALVCSVLFACAGLATACGGAAPAPEAPAAKPEPEPVASATPAAPAGAAPSASAAATPSNDSAEPTDAKAPPEGDSTPKPSGKDITYRMTSMGLVAELDGVELMPKAEPIHVGQGWGVKLVVKARALDDRQHKLQNPSQGPLMIAAQLDRKGNKEVLPDTRDGDGEVTVDRTGAHFERELKKPLAIGDTLTLHVGLWGFATGTEERKPIKKLFIVKMVVGAHKPQPVVSAPE